MIAKRLWLPSRLAGGAVQGRAARCENQGVTMRPDFAWLDATAQADLVRRGEVAPVELVDAAIGRIERLNPGLNAIIHPLFEKALEAATSPDLPHGPFRGVPMVIKDRCCHTAGDPFHLGMRLLRDLGWTESDDTWTAARLRAAGLVFVGRTNTPELGLNPTTEPAAYGPTRNPWDRTRSSGGSSGGSAAAVASGMVPLGHGTDSGGSIRIPASACGLVGLKPSRGRVSSSPAGLPAGGLSTEGALARSVRDAAGILDVLAAPAPGDPSTAPTPERRYQEEVGADPGRLRIGVRTRAPAGVADTDSDCVSAVERAAKLAESLGHSIEEAGPDALDELEFMLHFGAVTGADTAAELDDWEARTGRAIGPGDVEPATWEIAEMGRAVSAPQLLGSIEWLHGYTRRMATWWTGYDLLLTPTLTAPPPPLGYLMPHAGEHPLAGGLRAGMLVPFTMPFNATGQPAISLPLHWSGDGLPVGVQLAAAYGREDILIRVAAQIEQAAPWADRRPPLPV